MTIWWLLVLVLAGLLVYLLGGLAVLVAIRWLAGLLNRSAPRRSGWDLPSSYTGHRTPPTARHMRDR